MAAPCFLGLDAFPDGQVHEESPTLKRRVMRDKGEKVQKDRGGGIEHSHGKTWFRGRMIGQGGQGSVYLAVPTIHSGFPSRMAVKSAQMDRSSSVQREKRALSVLDESPNLVCFYADEITETKSGEKIYNLLMEYCSGGSLADHIKKTTNGLPEAEVACFARDIALGLDYMHNNGYAHCDIKPENILLVPEKPSSSEDGKYVAKIADFGLTVRMVEGEDDGFGIRGTLAYMAPEMLRDVKIDLPVDIWSFGCTVLEMLTGEPPWGKKLMKKNKLKAMEYIAYSLESPKIPDYVSENAKDFLTKCLDPVWGFNRWPAWKLLKHPFLSPATTDSAVVDFDIDIIDLFDIDLNSGRALSK